MRPRKGLFCAAIRFCFQGRIWVVHHRKTDNPAALAAFSAAECPKLLAVVHMGTEGIDVPCLDTVINFNNSLCSDEALPAQLLGRMLWGASQRGDFVLLSSTSSKSDMYHVNGAITNLKQYDRRLQGKGYAGAVLPYDFFDTLGLNGTIGPRDLEVIKGQLWAMVDQERPPQPETVSAPAPAPPVVPQGGSSNNSSTPCDDIGGGANGAFPSSSVVQPKPEVADSPNRPAPPDSMVVCIDVEADEDGVDQDCPPSAAPPAGRVSPSSPPAEAEAEAPGCTPTATSTSSRSPPQVQLPSPAPLTAPAPSRTQESASAQEPLPPPTPEPPKSISQSEPVLAGSRSLSTSCRGAGGCAGCRTGSTACICAYGFIDLGPDGSQKRGPADDASESSSKRHCPAPTNVGPRKTVSGVGSQGDVAGT